MLLRGLLFDTLLMSLEIVNLLKSGAPARLMPVAADSSREVRAASVLMAVLSAVPDFRASMLTSIGQRSGSRARLRCFTEVVFTAEPPEMKCRPDGLLVFDGGRGKSWTCLVEAKIGSADLEEGQVERYAALAKLNGIDAILTISNQFVATPTHTPLRLSKTTLKNIEIFHWSWMFVLTQAQLVLHEEAMDVGAEKFILSEFVRNLEHPSTGTTRFDQMNPEWKDLIKKVQSGAVLNRNDQAVEMSVAAWHQEMRDLSLMLSRQLRTLVGQSLPRAQKDDYDRRLRDDCDFLIRNHRLYGKLDIPDAAASLEITADLLRRSLNVSMSLAAPKDKQRASSRINWLLRQLTKSAAQGIQIRATWPGRANATQASLEDVRANPELLESENKSLSPTSFDVILVADLGGKFAGRKTFIEQLEEIVPLFYKDVGERLRVYVAAPPRISKDPAAKNAERATSTVVSSEEKPADLKPDPTSVLQEGTADKALPDSLQTDAAQGAIGASESPSSSFYYIDLQGEQHGPCSYHTLSNLKVSGQLVDTSYVFRVGDSEWSSLGTIDLSIMKKSFGG